MKKLVFSLCFVCLACSSKAQSLDEEQRLIPEKLRRDARPGVETGYDKEIDVMLLETPYVPKDISNYRSEKLIDNGPFTKNEDLLKNEQPKPMLPWQKKHPLLWNKPRS